MFATVLVLAVAELPDAGAEVAGERAGNRPAALPPGLSAALGVTPGRYGRLPTDTGEVLVTGVAGAVGVAEVAGEVGVDEAVDAAVTATVAEAVGSLGRLAALPVTVNWTDVTVDAVAATATRA